MRNKNSSDNIETGDIRIDEIMPELFSKWLRLPFEECLDEIGDYIKLKQKDTKPNGKFPVVDQGDELINGYVDDENLLYTGELPVIIFGDHTRRIKFIDFSFAVGADGTKIFKPKKFFNERFFNHYLNSLHITSEGYSRHYKFLKAINVPLPPLAEQHRIVAKLDTLLARVANCKNRLEKIPALLKNFRQSVLAAAVSGELTKEWREKNVSSSDLLNKMQADRVNAYENACKQAKKSAERKPSKPANLDEKLSIEDEVEQLVPEIPNDWKRIPLAIASDNLPNSIVDGPFGSSINVKTDYIANGVPVIRINNVRPLRFNNENLKFISRQKFNELERHKVVPGDILLAKVGATIGDCCIYPDGLQVAMLSTTGSCRITIDKNYFDEKYVCLVLNSMKQVMQQIASEVAQPFLNMQTVKNLPIPFCSLEEQKEIVRKVEELFHFADSIEARYQKAKTWFDKLPQAILAKAFRGELVEQDENDEPASVLLERIKKEKTTLRQAQGDKKQTNKPKPTAKRKKVYEENEGVSLAAEE